MHIYARTKSFTSIRTIAMCTTRIHVFVFNFMHKIVPFDSWWQPIHVIIFQNCLILSHRLSCRLSAQALAVTVISNASILDTPQVLSPAQHWNDATKSLMIRIHLAMTQFIWLCVLFYPRQDVDNLQKKLRHRVVGSLVTFSVSVQLNANKFGIKIAVESTRDECIYCIAFVCFAFATLAVLIRV